MFTRILLFAFVLSTAGLGLWSKELQRNLIEQKSALATAVQERDDARKQLDALRASTSTAASAATAADKPADAPMLATANLAATQDELSAARKHLQELKDLLARAKAAPLPSAADVDDKIRGDAQTLQGLKLKLSQVQAGVNLDNQQNRNAITNDKAQENLTLQQLNLNISQANATLTQVNQQLGALGKNKAAPNRSARIQLLMQQRAALQAQIQNFKQSRSDSQASAATVESATQSQIQDENAQAGGYEQQLKANIAQVSRDQSYWQNLKKTSLQDQQAARNQAITDAQAAVTEQQTKVTELEARQGGGR